MAMTNGFPTAFSVVAVDDDGVGGLALIQRDGEMQYRGAGKRMLRALEEQAARWGLRDVFLTSSVTAKRFYERNGDLQSGEPKSVHGLRPWAGRVPPTLTER